MTVLGPEAVVADELVLPYDPTLTQARADAWRKGFFRSLIGLGISVVIAVVIFLITRWNQPMIWFFYGFFGLLNVYRVTNALARWRTAVAVLKRTPWGTTAIQVDRDGIGMGRTHVSWAQVALLKARTPWSRKDSLLELSTVPASGTVSDPPRPVQATVAMWARVAAAVLMLIGVAYAILQSSSWLRPVASVLGAFGGASEQEAVEWLSGMSSGVAALVGVALGVAAAVGIVAMAYAAWSVSIGQGRAIVAVAVALVVGILLLPFSWVALTGFLVAAVIGLVFGVLVPEQWLRAMGADETLRLDQVPVVLSTIDQAVRTLSATQVRIDTRELDR